MPSCTESYETRELGSRTSWVNHADISNQRFTLEPAAYGNLLSLIASARLQKLDPEAYLRDVLRVTPHWPRDRFLELAPRYWPLTRGRLDPVQLDRELGPLAVPEQPLPTIGSSLDRALSTTAAP